MFRPKDWVVGGNPRIDGVQYHNYDDEYSYEAGADAMLKALSETGDKFSGGWHVFIPDEVEDATE